MTEESNNSNNLNQLIYEQSIEQTNLLRSQGKTIKAFAIGAFVLMLIIAIVLVALSMKISGVISEANTAVSQISEITKELDSILKNSGITALLNNANKLIEESGDSLSKALTGVDEALKKVGSIDIESLNSAISDLKSIIDPLARLFGKK